MNYKPYPDNRSIPNRKTRKTERNKIFQENKGMKKKLQRQQRLERKINE